MPGSNAPLRVEAPLSEAQTTAITGQLDRILGSTWFRTSPRCSTLLRHTVEKAIQGQAGQLHERLIGAEAFHRRPGYDSDADPVVRIAAGEVRRRLAQYYSEPKNVGQIRIELPIGSYLPIFHLPCQEEAAASLPDMELSVACGELQANSADAPFSVSSEPPPAGDFHAPHSRRWVKSAFAALLILLAIAGGAWLTLRPSRQLSGFDAFWAPVTSAQGRTLICVGEFFDQEIEVLPNGNRQRFSAPWTMDFRKQFPGGVAGITYDDSIATARIAEFLAKKGKDFDMLGQSRTSFNDLLNRPVILIGSVDNDWVIHFTDAMRFRFEMDFAQRLNWISDREKPTEKFGILYTALPDPANYETFAIVARNADPATGRPVVILAGVTSVGDLAATKFVSDPSYLNDFARHAPKDWDRKNIEFLIATPVVENIPGQSRIVAYNLW